VLSDSPQSLGGESRTAGPLPKKAVRTPGQWFFGAKILQKFLSNVLFWT
jgi:hypothetical protein